MIRALIGAVWIMVLLGMAVIGLDATLWMRNGTIRTSGPIKVGNVDVVGEMEMLDGYMDSLSGPRMDRYESDLNLTDTMNWVGKMEREFQQVQDDIVGRLDALDSLITQESTSLHQQKHWRFHVWNQVPAQNGPNVVYHSLSLYGSTVFLYGGISDPGSNLIVSNKLYSLDLSNPLQWQLRNTTNSTSDTGITSGRFNHVSVVFNHSMFIMGGAGIGGSHADFHRLALNKGEPFPWNEIQRENVPLSRYGHSANIWGSKMIVFGGNSFNDFYTIDLDGGIGDWILQPTENTPHGRRYHLSVLSNSTLWIWGGFSENYLPHQSFRDLYSIDLAGSSPLQWKNYTQKYPLSARYGGVGMITDEELFYFGGGGLSMEFKSVKLSQSQDSTMVWEWRPTTTPKPAGRRDARSFTWQNKWYIQGGMIDASTLTSDLWYVEV